LQRDFLPPIIAIYQRGAGDAEGVGPQPRPHLNFHTNQLRVYFLL
jgi:hypothetical protein